MDTSCERWIENICSGKRRAVARAISAVERGDSSSLPLLQALFAKAGQAYVIGITGSPGAGKSTLVEKLAAEYRRTGRRVGIVAIDPTSPFSGGAILGDRIRMQALANDSHVYIRSMATRGQMGGLAPAAQDVVLILDAAGYDVVLVETVGVGQDEVEVAKLADATVVAVVPGMGDDIQAFKAGVMEIADLFVINKADQPYADRIKRELDALLSVARTPTAWIPPILKTAATNGTGIRELHEALEKLRFFLTENPAGMERRRMQMRSWLLGLLRQRLFERVATQEISPERLDGYVEAILTRQRDPHSVVEEIIRDAGMASTRE